MFCALGRDHEAPAKTNATLNLASYYRITAFYAFASIH